MEPCASAVFALRFRICAVAFRAKTAHVDTRGASAAKHEGHKLTTSLPGAARAPSQPASGPIGQITGSIVQKVLTSLDDSKAEDVISIDLRGKTSIADDMVIATGRSTTHVGAIADRVLKACKEAGLVAPRVEGLPQCDWVLIDAGDVIVHIFRPEVRQFYNLEKMWAGARPSELRAV
jgi:ribosome-associated protein